MATAGRKRMWRRWNAAEGWPRRHHKLWRTKTSPVWECLVQNLRRLFPYCAYLFPPSGPQLPYQVLWFSLLSVCGHLQLHICIERMRFLNTHTHTHTHTHIAACLSVSGSTLSGSMLHSWGKLLVQWAVWEIENVKRLERKQLRAEETKDRERSHMKEKQPNDMGKLSKSGNNSLITEEQSNHSGYQGQEGVKPKRSSLSRLSRRSSGSSGGINEGDENIGMHSDRKEQLGRKKGHLSLPKFKNLRERRAFSSSKLERSDLSPVAGAKRLSLNEYVCSGIAQDLDTDRNKNGSVQYDQETDISSPNDGEREIIEDEDKESLQNDSEKREEQKDETKVKENARFILSLSDIIDQLFEGAFEKYARSELHYLQEEENAENTQLNGSDASDSVRTSLDKSICLLYIEWGDASLHRVSKSTWDEFLLLCADILIARRNGNTTIWPLK